MLVVAAILLAGCSGSWLDDSGSPYPALDPNEFVLEADRHSGLPWVEEEDLPVTAKATLQLIDAGGPFPYEQDGSTFPNRDRLLPDEPWGYYSEYTVVEPGTSDRGQWRIVAGEGGERYWTEDLFVSFERVRRGGS